MADKEAIRPFFTMSGGSCNLAQSTSSAATDLDNGRVPEETTEAERHQGENQAANIIQECELCGFAFPNAKAFQNHIADHLLGKDKQCSVCGKLFMDTTHHAEHYRVHTGEQPFECSVCGKKLSYKSSLKKHMLVYHKSAQGRNGVEGPP